LAPRAVTDADSEPKRHHYVPQFLLRRFANEPEQVLTIDRRSKSLFRQSVSKAAAQTGFYKITNDDGSTDNSVEHALGKIESRAAIAIAKLVDQGIFPLSDEDRDAVAAFMALQYVRTPSVREHMSQVADASFKAALATDEGRASMRDVLEDTGDYATPEEIEAELTFWTDPTQYRLTHGANEHARLMIVLAAGFSRSLFKQQLAFVRFERQRLATCDNPVLLEGSERTKYRGIEGRIGIMNADKIWLPLAPSLAICFTKDFADDAELEPHTNGARWLNWLTANHARRWIFHHPDHSPMKHITVPPWEEQSLDEMTLQRLTDPELYLDDPLDDPHFQETRGTT
jgi:hypothetical protein